MRCDRTQAEAIRLRIAGIPEDGPEKTPRLIIDADDLLGLLDIAQGLLTELHWAVDPPQPNLGDATWTLPDVLTGPAEAALDRIIEAVRPLLSAGGHAPRGRTLGSDGRYPHAPARVAWLAQHDLDLVRAAVLTCNRALAGGGDVGNPADRAEIRELADYLNLIEGAVGGIPVESPAGLTALGALARAVAVLDLPADPDTELLVARLVAAEADPAADVVLTLAEDAAYGRVANRLNALLRDCDPLSRYLY